MVGAYKTLSISRSFSDASAVVGTNVVEGPWYPGVVQHYDIGPAQAGSAEIITRVAQLIPTTDEQPLLLENCLFFQVQECRRGVPGGGWRESTLDRNVRLKTLDFVRQVDVLLPGVGLGCAGEFGNTGDLPCQPKLFCTPSPCSVT